MEGADKRLDDKALAQAMKGKGLGTPATRADTIERLLAQKYLERERREIIPTTKAEYLLDFLSAIEVETLTSPSLTGEWEHRLHHVEQGSLSREEFMSAIVAQTEDIISKVKNYSEENEVAKEVDVTSPSDNKPMLENFRAFKSQDGKGDRLQGHWQPEALPGGIENPALPRQAGSPGGIPFQSGQTLHRHPGSG